MIQRRLVDTAGLRQTEDPVERLGVERSRAAMEEAGLILAVVDRSAGLTGEALSLIQQALAIAPTLVVYNKCDLPPADIPVPLIALPGCIEISAKEGAGLEELGKAVAELFPQGSEEPEPALLTNLRQTEAAARAKAALQRAQAALFQGV